MEIIPIQALLDEEPGAKVETGYRRLLARAEVILGVDVQSQREFTVFGTPALEETVRVGKQQALRTVRIELDAESGDLEKLVALVRAVKGRYGYSGDE
jgi:hypothetical protein